MDLRREDFKIGKIREIIDIQKFRKVLATTLEEALSLDCPKKYGVMIEYYKNSHDRLNYYTHYRDTYVFDTEEELKDFMSKELHDLYWGNWTEVEW